MSKSWSLFSVLVVFGLLILLAPVAILAPPVVSAGEADLPNPLTVNFSATVSEGNNWSFSVVPNATLGSVINQFSRPWVILNTTAHPSTNATFYNMSTASGTTSGDLNGSIDFKWNRLDFEIQHPNGSTWYLGDPDGIGILYLNFNVTDTMLENLTFVGAADFDYNSTTVKGEGRVMSVEDYETGLTTPPSRVLIGDISYEYVVSTGAMTGTLSLRHYMRSPVGLAGKVDDQEWLYLSGNLSADETDWITNDTAELVQFTRGPVLGGNASCDICRIEMEEMAPGREENQTIDSGDLGVGGLISLMRTGVMDYRLVGTNDFPLHSVTATRTIENNWPSNQSATKGGVAKTIVLVDMIGADLMNGTVEQHSFTMMPGYSQGYEGTGFYAGFESYVVPNTTIYIATYLLAGEDFRYPLLPKPQVTSVNPNSGDTGATVNVTINGKFFWVNKTFHPLTFDFGSGVSVTDYTVVSDTQINATVSITGGAPLGAHNVSVTKRGVTGTLVDGFNVTAGAGAVLDGHVGLSGFGATNVTVRLFSAGTQTEVDKVYGTTDSSGNFTVSVSVSGTYDIAVKGQTSLSNLVQGVNLSVPGRTNFGVLLEGDALSSNDDYIDFSDYGPLSSAWLSYPGHPAWDSNVDFSRDNYIDFSDYGPLSANWLAWGDTFGWPGDWN